MLVVPSYLAALYSSLFLALGGKLRGIFRMRGVSATLAVLIILVIISLGALFVYVIVTTPGATSTVYP